MVLIALLLVALVCLALGLILASAPWLIGSLAASAVAALVLYRMRTQVAVSAAAKTSTGEGADDALVPGLSAPVEADHGDVWVVDGRPEYHVAGCADIGDAVAEPIPLAQATEDGFTPCPTCEPDAVRVSVGGSLPSAAGAAAALPSTAASPGVESTGVESTGVESPATVSDPVVPDPVVPDPVPDTSAALDADAVPGSEPSDGATEPSASAVPALDPEVWVVDGHPEYHLAGCTGLSGAEAEAIPLSQAVEDGFTACAVCRVDQVLPSPAAPPSGPPPAPAASPPTGSNGAVPSNGVHPAETTTLPPVASTVPVAQPGDVWVVDGRPRYHVADCLIIHGQESEPIPLSQAAEDGFMPCSLCEPNIVRAH